MIIGGSSRRAICAVAGLAALSGAPAQAADDKSTISAVGELLGYSSDPSADKIDYGERPKLVLPPRIGELPAPRESAERPGGWPADAAAVRHRNTDRYAVVPNAAPREQKQGLLERALSFGSKTDAPVLDEPSRRMLTEPPSGYRRPTTDLAKIRDTDGKKSGSWWNPMTYLGGGNDAEQPASVQAQGAQAQGAAQNAAASGHSPDAGWFQMPRFVLKDPNKE
jgi:hypothetical protein